MAIHSHSEQLASELRAELARRQLTTSWLARQTDIIQSSMSRKLRGERPFTFDEVVAIARALDIPIGDLIAMADLNGSAA